MKFAVGRSTVTSQYAIPCDAIPIITFAFSLVPSTWSLTSALLVGRQLPADLVGNNMCLGMIQATVTGQFSVLGLAWMASIYTVYDYNSVGKGYTMSFAQSGNPR